MLYKTVIVIVLGILIGLVAWDLSTRSAMPETRVDSSQFMWVKCPSCERMFYVENTQKKGWCPYDGMQFDFVADH
jgi:hypothetical protein